MGGAALTWGKTTAEGHGFDFELQVAPFPIVPNYGDIPFGDNRNFKDERTFFGIYVNDQWTPVRWFTLTFGARYDITSETLHVLQQEIGDPDVDVVDERSDNKPGPAAFRACSASWRGRPGTWTPSTSTVLEAQLQARRAEPHRGRGRADPRARDARGRGSRPQDLWFDGTLSLNVTSFHNLFDNLVVGIRSPTASPT